MINSVDPDQTDLGLHCFRPICFYTKFFSGIQHFKHFLKYCEREIF